MLLGQGLKLAIQALYFTLIARSLGAAKYGAFVGVVGLIGIAFPFGTLGSGYLLIKNVARDRHKFNGNWGRALSTTFLSSVILFGAVILVSRFTLPSTVPTQLVMLVGVSDLFGLSFIAICGQAFIAFDLLKWTAAINVLLSASRLGAAVTLVLLYDSPSALQWGNFYFGSTAIVTLVALLLVLLKLGPPTFTFSRTNSETREGFYFSVSQGAQTIYNDIDKTMLARLGTLDATGIYGAAYRLIDVICAPVSSLLLAAYTNLFRVGARGVSATFQYAKPLILRALAYATLVSIAILACAGVVPYILGGEYSATTEALRWLAILPVIKAVHYFLSDTLSGAGHQGLRTVIQVGVAAFNVLINLWLIPAYSWRGAAWSSIASDGLLACGICVAVLVLSRRQQVGTSGTHAFEARAEV